MANPHRRLQKEKYLLDLIIISGIIVGTYFLSANRPIVTFSLTSVEALMEYVIQVFRVRAHFEEKVLLRWLQGELTRIEDSEIGKITTSNWYHMLLFERTNKMKNEAFYLRFGLVFISTAVSSYAVYEFSDHRKNKSLSLLITLLSFLIAFFVRYISSMRLVKGNNELFSRLEKKACDLQLTVKSASPHDTRIVLCEQQKVKVTLILGAISNDSRYQARALNSITGRLVLLLEHTRMGCINDLAEDMRNRLETTNEESVVPGHQGEEPGERTMSNEPTHLAVTNEGSDSEGSDDEEHPLGIDCKVS